MHLSSRSNRLLGLAPGFLAAHPTLASAAANSPAAQSEGPWAVLQFTWESGETFGWHRIGTCLLIATALSLLLLWPFAGMIAGWKRVLARTTLFVGSAIVLAAAFVALACFVARSESMALLAALGVLCVSILLAQTRHLFATSRPAAAGVLGCYLVVAAGTLYGTELLTEPMPWTQFFSKSKEERSRTFAEWKAGKTAQASVTSAIASSVPNPMASPPAIPATAPSASPAIAPAGATAAPISTASPVPPRSGPDLQALYAQLQKTREKLDTNDPVAVARFNEQTAAYNEEKAIAAARARPQPPKVADSATPEKFGQNVPVAKAARR